MNPTTPATRPQPEAAWPTADTLAGHHRTIVELARERDGWTPRAWCDRLRQMANRCQSLHPERATELRAAAQLLDM